MPAAGSTWSIGGTGNDHVDGGVGDDVVYAGAGDDVVLGGAGADTLFGQDGSDQLFGGNGEDRIYASGGQDFVDAGSDDDTVFADGAGITILGAGGNDDDHARSVAPPLSRAGATTTGSGRALGTTSVVRRAWPRLDYHRRRQRPHRSRGRPKRSRALRPRERLGHGGPDRRAERLRERHASNRIEPLHGERPALTVAVTGPTGDLGIAIVNALERSRAVKSIVGMARRPFDPAEQGWRKTEYRQGDVNDAASVGALVKGADVVVHLAFAILDASDATRELNIDGSQRVFEEAAKAGVKRICYASSVAAYGFHDDNPDWLTEDVPPRGSPEHPYSQQKAEVERVLGEVLLRRRTRWPTRFGPASSPAPRRARCSRRFPTTA